MALTQITEKGIKDGEIINADINASAAIAGSKISPDFGSQNVVTTGTLGSGDLTITSGAPTLLLTETNGDPDYKIQSNAGVFKLVDTTNSADRLVVGTSGNVGIGTSSPAQILHLNKTSGDTYLRLQGGTNQGTLIHATDGTLLGGFASGGAVGGGASDIAMRVESGNNMLFAHGTTERMRIDSSGKVGIGETSMDALLVIKGDTDASTTPSIRLKDGTDTRECWISNTSGDLILANGGNDNTPHCELKMFDGNVMQFSTANSMRMRIDSSGNVGIGTASPAAKLEVAGSAHITGQDSVANTSLQLSFVSSEGHIKVKNTNASTAANLAFHTTDTSGNTNRVMSISHQGNVGIGTTSPNNLLHVDTGTASKSIRLSSDEVGVYMTTSNTGDTHGRQIIMNATRMDSGSSPHLRLGGQGGIILAVDTNTTRMSVDTSGNIGAPTGTNIYNASDERVKKNVTTLDKGLEAIKSLRPVSFNWIDGFCDAEKDKLYGFVAQEVQTIDSNLVASFGSDVKIGDDPENPDQVITDPLRVNEKFIIPILVKAVQELSAKVAGLEAA